MQQYEIAVFDEKVKSKWLEVSDEKTYTKEIIFAIQAIRNNDHLQKCDSQSIKNAITNVAMVGITLNPLLQQAFLIPRKGKAVLDISYRGLCNIAVDSTSVYDIDATAVFECDEFYYEMGMNPILRHVPKMGATDKEKGPVIAAYAVATLHHGLKKFVVLDKEKIERAKKSSQSGNVWNAHYDEMAKKTAVKLLYKLLPQSERMSVAVAAINEHEGIASGPTTADKLKERFEERQVEDVPYTITEAEVIPKRFDCPNGGFATPAVCADCKDREKKDGSACDAYRENAAA